MESKREPTPDERVVMEWMEWAASKGIMSLVEDNPDPTLRVWKKVRQIRDDEHFEPLCLSEIKSGYTDDVIRRELGSEECVRWPEQPVGLAHPCSGKGVFSRRCNRPNRK
jgi:hypothetical protein